MNNLTEKLISHTGHCCPYGFMIGNAERTNEQLADWLGVSPRTVVNMRKRVREGKWKCEEKRICEAGLERLVEIHCEREKRK